MIDLAKIGAEAAQKAKNEATLKVLEELKQDEKFTNSKKSVKVAMLAVELGISNNTVERMMKDLNVEL